MRKFGVLLKKELKELFTVQALIPILVSVLIFMLLGAVVNDAMEAEQAQSGNGEKLVVLDLDGTSLSGDVIKVLNNAGFNVSTKHQGEVLDIIHEAQLLDARAVLVIHQGFEKNALQAVPQTIDTYSILNDLSLMGQTGDATLEAAISQVNTYVSDMLIEKGLIIAVDPEAIKHPVVKNDYLFMNDQIANVSALEVKGFLMSQNTLIPIVMFMIIIYASQLLITALAAEKENKTMETLLSTPVRRSTIIGAKMTAAGLSALVYAVVYMFCFQNYMGNLMGSSSATEQLQQAMEQLGLTLGVGDYILLGISLFAGILVALALSCILGAFAEDVKKAQGYITPMMLLVLVPYLFSLFTDVNSASLPIKILLNAIPFTHPFQASSYLLLNQFLPVILGILYELVLLCVFLWLAAKIYASDKIFIMKHNGKKSSLKRSTKK